MKYSARLVTALAAVALLVAAVVGLYSTKTALAAVDGKVFLTNKYSNLTTESPAPSGRTTVSGTLYTTFVEKDTAGVAAQSIATNADVLIVTIVDADKDLKTTATTTATWTSATTTGASQVIAIPLASSPIVDDTGNGVVDCSDVTVAKTSGTATIGCSSVAAGSATVPGFITVTVAVSGTLAGVDLTWKTSAADTLSVEISSTQELTPITLTAVETGLTTGRFQVEVTLIDAGVTGAASTSTAPATIKVINGGVVTAKYVDTSPLAGGTKNITASATAETTAPSVSITAPTNNFATQSRRPTFSGTVADSGGAGLRISAGVLLYIDQTDDAANATTVALISANENTSVLPSGTTDGVQSSTFTFTPSADIPTAVPTTTKPDHKVDYQVQAIDLAGNIGWSDADSAAANTIGGTAGRGTPNVVRIDQVLPVIKAAVTGYSWDTTITTPARKTGVNTSIEVVFDGPIDSASIQASDFEATIGGSTQVPTAAAVFSGQANSVFLTFATAIPSSDKPVVKLATGASISDSAGNNLTTGSITSVDGLSPTLTVTLSGGSSVTSPASLTKSTMTVTVTSDESLSLITVEIYGAASATVAEQTLNVIPQGGNVFVATAAVSGLDGKKSVYVTGKDSAATVFVDLNQDGDTADTSETVGANTATKGKKDVADSAAIIYTLDTTAPVLTITPADAGTTDDRQPFVILDWGEAIATINKATFDAADISTTLSASSDRKKWIYKPTSDLTLAKHTVVAQATDDAGNKSGEVTKSFTVVERKAFELPLNPGWNLVSLRGEPSDTSINSVITGSNVSTVITYDPTATGGPWLVATRGTDGKLAGSLTTIDGTHGYWINSTSFEAIKVLDPKPTGGSLPPAIPVSAGWNLVPARDITGTKTAGTVIATSTVYFNGTKIQRAYKFDTLTGAFVQLVLTGTTPTDIKVGEAYWAYFTEAGAVVP